MSINVSPFLRKSIGVPVVTQDSMTDKIEKGIGITVNLRVDPLISMVSPKFNSLLLCAMSFLTDESLLIILIGLYNDDSCFISNVLPKVLSTLWSYLLIHSSTSFSLSSLEA